MIAVYEKSVIKLVQILDERIKDPSCRKMLEDMKKDVNISDNSKNSIVLYLLRALFVPTTKKAYVDSSGKRCLQKCSIKDSQNSLVMVANTIIELEENMKSRKQKNIPIQPCMLIL
ncbi:uncharacterized protein LOC112681557 [Sipha flava]|uniref:Uncharacterized protein LOC112681557 n=1 Tax=Sipha flava TaxID=143950 RepID=A0A8B8FB03_9HEMI|nr:uncharacterized protein LOC112681557 [Sipha flava]